MKIHSLDCATLCPASRRLVNGDGGWLEPARMVCHCWLIEARDGLVLVDTGIGLADVEDVRGRLGGWFAGVVRPRAERTQTAAAQIEALGYRREDVRHIVPTHLDLDHAGGLPDFPHAEVHVLRPEHDAALARRTQMERRRYRPAHFAHGPKWRIHDVQGDRWYGFESVRALGDGDDEILLVPLFGHTRGHCAVAARGPRGFQLHAGDAYFFHGEVRGGPATPPGLAFFERLAAIDVATMRANQRRLAELVRTHDEVRVHCAHCPVEYEAMRAAIEPPAASGRAYSNE